MLITLTSVQISVSFLVLSTPIILEHEERVCDPALFVARGSHSAGFSDDDQRTNVLSIVVLEPIGLQPNAIRCRALSDVSAARDAVGQFMIPAEYVITPCVSLTLLPVLDIVNVLSVLAEATVCVPSNDAFPAPEIVTVSPTLAP